MKIFFFTEEAESISVKTIWISSVIAIILMIALVKPGKHVSRKKIHLLKLGAFKDIPTQKSLININIALESELIQLDGIGPSLAKKIVDFREKNGYFHSLSDLSQVKGIGKNKLAKITKQVTL